MVLQEPYLFSGTVFENIRYAKTDATRAAVVETAKAVGAHDFIMRLNGARILVLDEATANVDSHTELEIQRALARLLEGRTAIIIAHRLATIRGADRIVVLQDGGIIETGDHDALMALGGLYSRLYRMNYASFDDIPADAIAPSGEGDSCG